MVGIEASCLSNDRWNSIDFIFPRKMATTPTIATAIDINTDKTVANFNDRLTGELRLIAAALIKIKNKKLEPNQVCVFKFGRILCAYS